MKKIHIGTDISSGGWICRKIINTLNRIDWWIYRLDYFDNRIANGRTLKVAWYMSRQWADHVMRSQHIGESSDSETHQKGQTT
jgi:hypothetical protein